MPLPDYKGICQFRIILAPSYSTTGLEAREFHFQNHLSMVFPVRFSQWGVLVRDLEAEVMQTGVGIVREVGWGGRG